MSWLKRGRAVPKPSGDGYAVVITIMPEGSRAGVIMPDGSIVRGAGEPPPAQARSWYRPAP